MGLNQLIVKMAIEKANSFKQDTMLLDAIVEMDKVAVCYLVNNKYKEEVKDRGFIKELVNVDYLIEMLESCLNSKRINVAM